MQIKKIVNGMDQFSEWSGKIFIWLVIPLTGLVVFEVISRRFFDAPHIWSLEVIDFVYGPYFMLVAAYTLLHQAHVRIVSWAAAEPLIVLECTIGTCVPEVLSDICT